MNPLFTALLVCVGFSSHAQANNCEALRQQIETKIAAAGVTAFSVTVADADAAAQGQVVGRCAQGSKKIVYARSAAALAADTPRKVTTITECKDGSAPVGGSCKK
jgi:hypothetical protein